MVSKAYPSFIQEAFIDPIRSVLIVDDDYPTYQDVLSSDHTQGNGDVGRGNKDWRTNPDRIARVIRSFRDREQPLLVDIDDGQNISPSGQIKRATHLHQCDLLVLDFQLDRATQDGARAIEILRRVMSNNHFNLVIIYTNAELDDVFDDIRWGLIRPSEDQLSDVDTEAARDLIRTAEESIEDENFYTRLYESITTEQYFHSRLRKSSYFRTMAKGEQPYRQFYDQAKLTNWTHEQRKLVFRHLLKEAEHKGVNGPSTGRVDNLEWSTGNAKWIKSNSAFVALSHKSEEGNNLISILQLALNDWCPPPSQLFLTRLRAEIDEHGVAEQVRALNFKNASAYWYHRLLKSNSDEDRRWLITENVSRHTEQMLKAVEPQVVDFASRLIHEQINSGDPTDICKAHFGVDLNKDKDKEKALLEHNAFVCSTEPAGGHLTTGHVFFISDEYWLCLSPACDMVPGQKRSRNKVYGDDRLPFLAIKLQPSKPERALQDADSNRYLFLRINRQNSISSYCFNSPQGVESAPEWHIYYAENHGRVGQDFNFFLTRIKQGKKKLISERLSAVVVSQLRYEYALNLIQKLGVSITRIGLDFVAQKKGI